MKLTVEVTEQDGAAILAWAATPHRVFVTSSVPALHMWNVQSVTPWPSWPAGHVTEDDE